MLAQKGDEPFGRTSENPLPKELLKEKFDNCCARVLSQDAVARLYTAIQGFEKLKDVRDVTALAVGKDVLSQRPARAASA